MQDLNNNNATLQVNGHPAGSGCSDEAKKRARKASREILKERNDTSGGGSVRQLIKLIHIIY